MGAICGTFGEVGEAALGRMQVALRRRGKPVYAAARGPCRLSRIGTPRSGFEGDAGAGAALVLDGQVFEPDGRLADLHAAQGESFVASLDGAFALAVTDGNRLLLARDRCGVRPLFYASTSHGLLFASEIKALLQAMDTAPVLDAASLRQYYVFGDHMLGDSTLFAGIRQVPPGFCLVAERREGALHLEARPFVGPLPGVAEDEDALAHRIFEAVQRNVRRCVEQAERPGVLLSGGFDSSVLAALAVQHAGKRVTTFTISDHPDFPDVVAARRVAAHLGTRHEEFIVSADADQSGWMEGIHAYEDLIYRNTIFLLAKHVAGRADVVLSGAGADFLGPSILRRGARLEQSRARWRELSPLQGCDALLRARMAALEADERQGVQTHFATDYMPNQLFPASERAFQYFGVEVGFPFACNLTHHLSWALGEDCRERNGVEKPLLRKAFAGLDLPEDIKLRPTFCSKENLLQSKRNLSRYTARADSRLLEQAVPDELKPLVRSKFQAMKLAFLRRVFVELRGELPADAASCVQ